jgi:hypothetical protein
MRADTISIIAASREIRASVGRSFDDALSAFVALRNAQVGAKLRERVEIKHRSPLPARRWRFNHADSDVVYDQVEFSVAFS